VNEPALAGVPRDGERRLARNPACYAKVKTWPPPLRGLTRTVAAPFGTLPRRDQSA